MTKDQIADIIRDWVERSEPLGSSLSPDDEERLLFLQEDMIKLADQLSVDCEVKTGQPRNR